MEKKTETDSETAEEWIGYTVMGAILCAFLYGLKLLSRYYIYSD